MTIKLIQPSFSFPALESLLTSPDGAPIFTGVSHGLQLENQLTLWELLLRSGAEIPDGPVLDAGCGDGLFFASAPYTLFKYGNNQAIINDVGINVRQVFGIDKDPRKVRHARRNAETVSLNYAAQTATEKFPQGYSTTFNILEPADLSTFDIKSIPQVGMVWSNSMFHWIREPRDKLAAIKNFYDTLKKDGILCINMSAGGTAAELLSAYNLALAQLGDYQYPERTIGCVPELIQPDPIGRRPLDELVSLIRRNNFELLIEPAMIGETKVYSNPIDYVRAVQIYGSEAFLHPFPSYGRERAEKFWSLVETEFLNILRNHGWKDGEPWGYMQFNDYVIARKKNLPPKTKKQNYQDIGRILNLQFLQLGYQRILGSGEDAIPLTVTGRDNELENRAVSVDIHGILNGIFQYAKEAREPNDKDPITIGYEVSFDRTLTLNVNLRSTNAVSRRGRNIIEGTIEEILKQGVIAELKSEHVEYTFANHGGGRKSYSFKMPIFDKSTISLL